ncbi:Aldo/keto reductase [Lentibacillus persicus]|uniref:Aldo/keto reductase n=1 Tax=Lentibacillus persicus TaxID=640948 RepID=A0A1I1XCV5_9BACI|nr:aldo/keto reductase [Lentibacillus persicus]SFE05167.1 Aldo/keto reductase [Lentibacillus persicus]
MSSQVPEITLNDGLSLPAISSAIDQGYRLIDAAYNYENEGTVGAALKRTAVPRAELRIASKLPGRYHTYDKAVKAIQESLYRADLDYYDLYLIHWPNPIQDQYVEAWQALIDAKKWGLIRSIGVSNFLPEHMERLKTETGVLPSINQVELHPFFNQSEQHHWHVANDVATQAWSPLARTNDLFTNDTITKIAKKHNKTVSQVILRWHYQIDSLPIPKSASPKRQLENLSIFDFDLDNNDMAEMNMLTRPDGRMNDQDPAVYEEF